MISFLEFVCEKLMGPPIGSRSWRCPFHDDNTPSFTVNPPKQRDNGSWYAIKFRCHAGSCVRAGLPGDEWDLLTHFFPDSPYKQQVARWRKFADEYEQLFRVKIEQSYRGDYLQPGDGAQGEEAIRYCLAEFRSVLREAATNWTEAEAGLMALVWVDRILTDNGVSFSEFSRACASEVIQSRQLNRWVS